MSPTFALDADDMAVRQQVRQRIDRQMRAEFDRQRLAAALDRLAYRTATERHNLECAATGQRSYRTVQWREIPEPVDAFVVAAAFGCSAPRTTVRIDRFVAPFPVAKLNQHEGKTACIRGHAFTPENTHIRADGSRDCRRCNAELARERRAAVVS